MILVEDWKFHICLFLDKNSPRNNKMSDKSSRKKKKNAPRLLKYGFYMLVILYFFKGVNP